MKIKVYNANQIGGCFTTITVGDKTILIDYGEELPGAEKVQEEIDWDNANIDAVFFTHYHGDHVGKIMQVPQDIPMYMGEASREIMLNIHKALAKVPELRQEQEGIVNLLESNFVHIYRENEEITDIEGMVITPYSVDHSAYDAHMFLVEGDGEVALHTGDYRGHGYRGKNGETIQRVIKKYIHKNGRKVDYLITEGTMMGERGKKEVLTESQLKERAIKLFKKHKYVFVIVSSTNLDSLASFYQAARKTGKWLYCYNFYLKTQLDTFTKYAGSKTDLYKFDTVDIVKFDAKRISKKTNIEYTQEELIRKNGGLFIIKPEDKYQEWIEKFSDKGEKPLIIYSMWDGYINPEHKACNKEWMGFFEKYIGSEQFEKLHTSGHATPDLIEKVIKAVDPQKKIIPMHTENRDGFIDLDIEKYIPLIRKEEVIK